MEPKCCFCEAQEHFATNGPKGPKIVQYFACQKFVEMAPKDRFQELKNKGHCFQCLFPEASLDEAKHCEGICQKDFLCKCKSHDKYSIKKQVLVCHEHRNDTENQELQKYKDRFIIKQPDQLPLFSRDLKLSFHMNQNQSPNSQEMSDQEKAIYILQTIQVEQYEYSLFYDTGCCDMVSQYVVIKSIGKEHPKNCLNL